MAFVAEQPLIRNESILNIRDIMPLHMYSGAIY